MMGFLSFFSAFVIFVLSRHAVTNGQEFQAVGQSEAMVDEVANGLEKKLQIIHDATNLNLGELCSPSAVAMEQNVQVKVPLEAEDFETVRQKADLAAAWLGQIPATEDTELIKTTLRTMAGEEPAVAAARILVFNSSYGGASVEYFCRLDRGHPVFSDPKFLDPTSVSNAHYFNVQGLLKKPWFDDWSTKNDSDPEKFMPTSPLHHGWWTYPYFSCEKKAWFVSYSVPVLISAAQRIHHHQPQQQQVQPVAAGTYQNINPGHRIISHAQLIPNPDAVQVPQHQQLQGGYFLPQNYPVTPIFISVDVDVSGMDINQCDHSPNVNNNTSASTLFAINSSSPFQQEIITAFQGTHKCDRKTTECHFLPGNGWDWGSYECHCQRGFFPESDFVANGTLLELAWRQMTTWSNYNDFSNTARSLMAPQFSCKPCAPGCTTCVDGFPCLAEYNWIFRTALLAFSMLCVCFTLFLVGYVYKYRHLKIFKIASPIFLCITLVGCAVMYLEMAAIFPVLDTYSCVATKWTRHFGFCITYSALLMKTWRVSLTFRVKSAHKMKLTDKQLLQWLVPILLVMGVYLSAWTASSPPNALDIEDSKGLRFTQCEYNWWDHALAVGEIVFLAWGIKICLGVRNAETYLDEARYISYAIYNIASINAFMLTVHLFIFPNAGPDTKYLFGFIRTQLSTSTTIVLVFFPKIYRVMRGLGDAHDNRARAKGVTASFSLNGIGYCGQEEVIDVYQENEELKEELQKLAAQVEYMKIVHMQRNNPHLKTKPGSYFHPDNMNNSVIGPVVKFNSHGDQLHRGSASIGGRASIYSSALDPSAGEGNGNGQFAKLSPAAEMVSEKV